MHELKSVLILGLGKSAVAVARHALACSYEVTVYAGPSSDAARERAAELERLGAHIIFDTEQVAGHFNLCVPSPGIPETGSFFQAGAEASDEIVSEPEYAWRLSPQDWVAITGTNGKTTTTSLTAHVLEGCGYTASACGNIGDTATEAVEARRDGEVLVVEMSSYQLAATAKFSPRAAALLNITPDHISWHGSLEAYAAAKLKVFANMGPGQTAVLCEELDNVDELETKLREQGMRVVLVGVQRECDCAWCGSDGVLRLADGEGNVIGLVDSADLAIQGAHNRVNALVAASLAYDLGCAPADIAKALMSFAPLEHRIEPAGTVDGVRFVNDSKATNPEATLKALTAFPKEHVVLLLGGRDKGTDLSELVEACEAGDIEAIMYGEAAQRFAESFAASTVPTERVAGMREAFALACEHAASGDVVLLSPACASFDEFTSFNERGQVFKQLVSELVEAAS